jgi:hypothetical protein
MWSICPQKTASDPLRKYILVQGNANDEVENGVESVESY